VKVVVVGGTGLVGSKVVERLRQSGNDVVGASPRTGIDAFTGEGLADAFAGAQAVVDVSNEPDDAAALEFFTTSSRNIVAAEEIGRASCRERV